MSYLVFARKWRPKNFDEVVGQEAVTRTLKNAVKTGKVAQAYLFSGSHGVGKTSCARILAKALNCVEGPTETPCGVCPACLEIGEGRSLDVIEIDGASNRGIDEIRTLRDNVKFAPLNGRTKVYIIDEVHMLTAEAFNALLKTLEEPPPYVKFVFATTEPQKVPGTILSRCQRFDFGRLSSTLIAKKLKEIASEEHLDVSEDVLFEIARASDGALRDAESILDQMISFATGRVALADVVAVLGLIEQKVYFELVERLTAGDAAGALTKVAEVVESGKDLSNFLEGLLVFYRNLMVLKIAGERGEGLVEMTPEESRQVAELARRLSIAEIMTAINNIFAAQDMSRKLNAPRLALEVLTVKLAMSSGKKTGEAVASPAKPVPSERPRPVPAAKPAPSPKPPLAVLKEEKGSADANLTSLSPAAAACTLEDVKNGWSALIARISERKMSLASYLKDAVPVGVEAGTLVIGFPKRAVFFKEALGHKDNLKILEQAVEAVCRAPLRLRLEIVEGLEPPAGADAPASPLLKSTLELFNGKIIT